MPATSVFALFPTPVMHVPGALAPALAQALLAELAPQAALTNHHDPGLLHSRSLNPAEHPLLQQVLQACGPQVVAMGLQLFGEALPWLIKELWLNCMATGGQQAAHNHANSFVSGVLYLTPAHPGSATVFRRPAGGNQFVMAHAHAGAEVNDFNAEKWAAPAPQAGDLLLFPSYLVHEVPANAGPTRATLAFNAIPQRLESWGYALRFGPG